YRFWPVWLALAAVLVLSFAFRRKLGLYGHLISTGVGLAGVLICAFWLFTALFAHIISPFGPLEQIVVMKHALPGTIEPKSGIPFYFGGDKLARDVFSRMVYGSRIVLAIAPAATAISLLVGSLLGLPAGYFGGRVDSFLSFVANLVLAFPVILLFYLLVTPGIMETAVPYAMAGFFFLFPILFFVMLFYTGYEKQRGKLGILLGATLLVGGYIYAGLVFDSDPFGIVHIEPNELNIFVAVAFASSPGVFRIVRGLTLDIKTREYINAALTRGERPWYIMLWEILPNARGPLIVDTCLRIGYTTILLGTLGFFGLGMSPESPDWGTAIKDGSQLLRLYAWPPLAPAVALGLNLLADALREQSLRD
ncbi:MAG: ABC transporter permease, partial [Alphaproteobacteria bacterium]|nr:ABC transporter permease [Alphaproteobacteria bacterium]